MTKILFTDLDGTLLMSNNKISASMKIALTSMVKAGHILVLSSGRPLASILAVKEEAELNFPNVYIIANNGSTIYNCDTRTVLSEKRLSFEDTMFLMQAAWKKDIHIHTYTDTHILCLKESKELDFYRSKVILPYILTDQPTSLMEHGPFKVLAVSLDTKDSLEAFKQSLLPEIEDRMTAIFSNDNYLEFFSKEAGKGNALKELCNYLNIPVENTLAAGDAENDLSMLEAAGTSIAMINGDPLLKNIADYVTICDNNHDGLLEVIEKFIIKSMDKQ